MAFTFPQTFPRPGRQGPARKAAFALAGAGLLVLAVAGGVRLWAQIEGDRGIAPLANSADIQVSGIEVDVTGKTAAEARAEGWKLAEKKAWEKLGGPAMPVESIDAFVSSIVIEREQIGPRRYIARLGVIFDKAKAAQYVGASAGIAARSVPLLTIPVLHSGGVQQVFEVRGPWQRAWAQFQAAASPIDYVRPVGAGGESLILTAGQPGRRSRAWWRTVLDQFDAADVIVPEARLERQWPGGPVRGMFTARYGPDNTFLGSFAMTTKDEDGVPKMLDEAVLRIDRLYRDALTQGLLRPDPTINSGRVALDRALEDLRVKLMPKGPVASGPSAVPTIAAENVSKLEVLTISVQYPSPDAKAVDAALAAARGAPGVQSAATASLAIGGTSVMRVTVEGGADRLAAGLRAQGWKVSGSGLSLRISR